MMVGELYRALSVVFNQFNALNAHIYYRRTHTPILLHTCHIANSGINLYPVSLDFCREFILLNRYIELLLGFGPHIPIEYYRYMTYTAPRGSRLATENCGETIFVANHLRFSTLLCKFNYIRVRIL